MCNVRVGLVTALHCNGLHLDTYPGTATVSNFNELFQQFSPKSACCLDELLQAALSSLLLYLSTKQLFCLTDVGVKE